MSIRRLEKDFDLALAVVDRSGLAPTIEERLSSAQGGRPRKLPVRMLLAALLIAPSARYANAYLTTVHAILAVDLPASYRRREGLTSGMPGTDGESVTLRQVRYLFNQIVKAMDFSQVTGPSDAVERDAREAATISQLNDLVRASLPEDLPAPDLVAIDATALATWSSTVSKRNPDPDARWGHKTPTPSNDSKDVYGYQINAAATAYTPGSKYQSLKAVIAFDFKQANADLAPSTITMLDEHILPFAPDADIVVDRGYSQWAADRWANLLTERGINQHLDLKKDDLKAVADLDPITSTGSSKATGVRMFAGWPFAPHTPPSCSRSSVSPVSPNSPCAPAPPTRSASATHASPSRSQPSTPRSPHWPPTPWSPTADARPTAPDASSPAPSASRTPPPPSWDARPPPRPPSPSPRRSSASTTSPTAGAPANGWPPSPAAPPSKASSASSSPAPDRA